MKSQQQKDGKYQEMYPFRMSKDACDETKCVSKGLSELVNETFTCYGDNGAFYPMMCADGFLPKIVEAEPPYVEPGVDESQDISLQYFTCCPPDRTLSREVDVTRHCSDPFPHPKLDHDESIDTICDDQVSRKYPRRMKSSTPWSNTDSIICCDSIPLDNEYDEEYDYEYENESKKNITMAMENSLKDTECVPYRNEFYKAAKIQNKFGMLVVVSCDFPEGEFQYARSIEGGVNTDVTSDGLYQCCKHGPALPPFVRDSQFRFSVYPTIFICSIALCCSTIVFFGVLLPLLIQLQNGSYRKLQRRQKGRRRCSSTRVIRSSIRSSTLFFKRSFNSANRTQRNRGSMMTSHNPSSSVTKSTPSFYNSRNSTILASVFQRFKAQGGSSLKDKIRDTEKSAKEASESARFETQGGPSMRDKTRDASEKSDQSTPSMATSDSEARSKRPSHGRLESQITTISIEGEPTWVVATQQSSTIKAEQQCFSSYNLYLVHLSFPDILYTSYQLFLNFQIVNQRFNHDTYSYIVYPTEDAHVGQAFEWPFVAAYVFANLCINAILAYELLNFLRTCKSAKRIKQPSLTRVNIQAGSAYLGSLLLLTINVGVGKAAGKAIENGDFKKSMTLWWILVCCNKIVWLAPIGYIIYVSTLIWWKGYMPSLDAINAKGRAMRELAFYIFRIIAVVTGIWLPVIIICLFSMMKGQTWAFPLATQIGALQVIVSTIVILTKRDVRKYVTDLITLSYLISTCKDREEKQENAKAIQEIGRMQQDSPNLSSFEVSDNKFDKEEIEFETSSCQEKNESKANQRCSAETLEGIDTTADLEGAYRKSDLDFSSDSLEEVGSTFQQADGTADYDVDSNLHNGIVLAATAVAAAGNHDCDDDIC